MKLGQFFEPTRVVIHFDVHVLFIGSASLSTSSLSSKLFLWDKRTLYIGPLPDPISLSQGASTLLVSLNGDFHFKTKDMETLIATSSLLIPAGLNIHVDTGDKIIANCNLDPLCEDFFYLSKSMNQIESNAFINLEKLNDFKATYQKFREEPYTSDSAYKCLDNLFLSSLPDDIEGATKFSTDQRIIDVVELIKEKVDDNLSVETLAAKVGLSEPRLMQLFKEKTGVPIRRYRLWHRLYTTSQNLAKGYSLTDAALLAGFTDSAHFSKTFKDMLGMSPTRILGQPNGIQIITEPVSQ